MAETIVYREPEQAEKGKTCRNFYSQRAFWSLRPVSSGRFPCFKSGEELLGDDLPRYAPYTTTVIGAHSVPRWSEALDRMVGAGHLTLGDLADAQLRATQAAILDQEIAGIDVITGGEMHRRTHNRHAPPNAMLNYFWEKIPSFHGETKPKPITPT